MSFKQWKAQNGVASKQQDPEQKKVTTAPNTFQEWKQANSRAWQQPTQSEEDAAVGRYRPNSNQWTQAEAASAAAEVQAKDERAAEERFGGMTTDELFSYVPTDGRDKNLYETYMNGRTKAAEELDRQKRQALLDAASAGNDAVGYRAFVGMPGASNEEIYGLAQAIRENNAQAKSLEPQKWLEYAEGLQESEARKQSLTEQGRELGRKAAAANEQGQAWEYSNIISDYGELINSPDFAVKSQYVPPKESADEIWKKDKNDPRLRYMAANGDGSAQTLLQHNAQSDSGPGNIFDLGGDYDYLFELTDTEKGVYNALYAASAEAADNFLEKLKPYLEIRARDTYTKRMAAYAAESTAGAIGMSAASVDANLLQSGEYIIQLGELLSKGKINPNNPAYRASQMSNAVRGEVSKMVEDKWGKAGSFAYNTGMSMADFLTTTALSGGSRALSLGLMGTRAAANTVLNLKDRGLDDASAFTLGTIAGAAEILTESFSLEQLLNPDLVADGIAKNILKNVLAEASEEGASDLINWAAEWIYDAITGKNEAEWKQQVYDAIQNGADPNEAVLAAIQGNLIQLGTDMLGGGISGGIMAGAGTPFFLNNFNASQQGQYANAIRGDEEGLQALIQSGLESPQNTESRQRAEKMEYQVAKGGTPSTLDVARLVNANQQQIDNETAEQSGRGRLVLPGTQEASPAPQETRNTPRLTLPTRDTQTPQQPAETPILTLSTAQQNDDQISAFGDEPVQTESDLVAQLSKSKPGLMVDDYVRSKLSDNEIRAIDETAKRLGLRVGFVDNGTFDDSNARIYGKERVVLIERGNRNPIGYLYGHEMGHWLQQNSPDAYKEFAEAARAAAPEWFKHREEQYNAKLHETGKTMTAEELQEEILCDYAGWLVQDEDVLNKFIEQNKDKPNVLRRLYEAIKALAAKLTGKEKQKANTAADLLLRAMNATEANVQNNIMSTGEKSSMKGLDADATPESIRESDENYMSAVNSGDMETAQRMVDEAAKASGYTIKAYHGTTDDFTKFSRGEQGRNHDGYLEFGGGFYFTPNENEAREWVRRGRSGLSGKAEPKVMSVYLSPRNIINADEPIPRGAQALQSMGMSKAEANFIAGRTYRFINYLAEDKGFSNTEIQDELKSLGYDAIDATYRDGTSGQYVVFDPDQIKSADPVTRDNKGKVIPLSERFNPEEDDTRFSLKGLDYDVAPESIKKYEQATKGGRPGSGKKGTVGPRKKISRVRTHAFELGGLYNEVEAQMAETQPGEFTYDPVSEKRSMDEALGRLRKDFTGEAKKLASSDQWGGSDLDTAMGILYQYRQIGRDTGNYSLFNEWSHVIQEKGTKGGQFVQAFAKYSRTATERARKAAENLREKAGKLTPAEQKRVEGYVNDITGAADNDIEGAARGAVEKSKGKGGLKLPSNKDTQRGRDAENIIRQIHEIWAKEYGRNHGVPVELWTKETGDQLASKIASRLRDKSSKTQTTMQTILGDLLTFAQEHALPTQEARQHRTALDRITDYLNNREAYAEAWGEAKQVLRDMYADDEEKLEALESFLNATISYNGEDFDRTMYRAILESADLLGMSKQDILDLAAAGTTDSVIDRIADEFIRRVGTDDETLRDTVARHINNLVTESNVSGRLERMENEASKALDIKLQEILRESHRTKADAANRVAQYLINELGISGTDAAIAADHIAQHFMDQLQQRADKALERMFAEKKTITRKQHDKLLDLIHLGGLTNANVEDAVVDALGLNKVSREQQRKVIEAMAQMADIYDSIEDDDIEALRSLIRQQAAIRKTPLSNAVEKILNGVTDVQYLKDFALAQLDLIAADYVPRNRGEKISTFQTLTHLLNLRTSNRNIGSNQLFDLLGTAANNVALIPDYLMGKKSGQRGVGLQKSWLSHAKRQGAVQGAKQNILEVAMDVNPSERNKSKYGTGGRRTWSMANSNTLGRLMSRFEEAMGYELNTTDAFHKGSVYAETLESLARWVDAGYVTEEWAMEQAEKEALYRSFQDETLIGDTLATLKDMANYVGVGDSGKRGKHGRTVHSFGPGDLIVKYTQVPGALLHRAIEFSPLGAAKAIYTLGKWQGAVKNGEPSIDLQRDAALALGRCLTGSALLLPLVGMVLKGIIHRADDDDKNAAALHTAQGLSGTQLNVDALGRWIAGEETSIQEGDKMVDLNFLEPADGLMTIAAMLAKDWKGEDKTVGDKIKDIFLDSTESILESASGLSPIQTAGTIFNTLRYYNPGAQMLSTFSIRVGIAASSVSGFIPAPIRQLAQATDTVYRDQYRSQNLGAQIQAKVANSVPGLRQKLAPKITPLGEDKAYQAPALNALNALFNPGSITVYQQSELVDELDRVYEATGDAKIYPEQNAPYSITITVKKQKSKYTLTPDERTEYQRTRGQITTHFMGDVMSAGWYKKLSAEEQADILNWCGNFANFVAKKEMLAGRGVDYTSTTYDKYYASWEEGRDPANVVADAKKIDTSGGGSGGEKDQAPANPSGLQLPTVGTTQASGRLKLR